MGLRKGIIVQNVRKHYQNLAFCSICGESFPAFQHFLEVQPSHANSQADFKIAKKVHIFGSSATMD
jgi:hypothetical protein